MSNTRDQLTSLENVDSFDSYYECITACYGLEGEDIECMTECVAVHLGEEAENQADEQPYQSSAKEFALHRQKVFSNIEGLELNYSFARRISIEGYE